MRLWQLSILPPHWSRRGLVRLVLLASLLDGRARTSAPNVGQMPMPVRSHFGHKSRLLLQRAVGPLCLAAVLAGGCATSSQWVKVRDIPHNPLAGTLDLV